MKKSDERSKPLIYLITSGNLTTENFERESAKTLHLIALAAAANIPLIQIREKQIPARLICQMAAEAVRRTRNSETKILVNDRADIALATAADGVHLTSVSIPTQAVRRNFPARLLIGVSVHSLETAQQAKEEGADFVTFGPVYMTPSKADYGKPQGLEKLREVTKKLEPFPVIAIGGIDETNYRMVLDAGADGFAAIRFLNQKTNIKRISDGFHNRDYWK